MIASQLPVLQVVLPLLAAPLCLILRRPGPAWAIATGVTWVSLAIALALLGRVLETGTIHYPLGDWAAPWGIEYRIDTVNAFVLVLVTTIGSVVMPYARASVEAESPEPRIYWV